MHGGMPRDHDPAPIVSWQRWHDLLFAHWDLDPAVVAQRLPDGLEPETFDGRAFVGVVPFRMSGVRPRFLPPCPGLSAFPELNVRTYVRSGNDRGVWFFSLDADNRVFVAGARRLLGLPYFRATMECRRAADGTIGYRSERTHRSAPPARFVARYGGRGPAEPARPGSLEEFLVERYRLFTFDRRGRLLRVDVRHAPWELQRGFAEIAIDTMAVAAGFDVDGRAPLLHFGGDRDVAILAPRGVAAHAAG